MTTPRTAAMRTGVLLSLAVASFTASATEDGILLRCDPDGKELVVEYLVDRDPTDSRRPQGEFVRFRDHLEIERCGRDRANAGDACTVRDTRTAVRACRLGARTLSVRITPAPYNFNLQGYCGARISGVLEIRDGERLLMGPTPLDASADCAAEGVQVVRSVRILRDEAAPRVTYQPRPF